MNTSLVNQNAVVMTGKELFRYVSAQKQGLISVRDDGNTYRKQLGTDWVLHLTKKSDVTLKDWLDGKKIFLSKLLPWQLGEVDFPTQSVVERWILDGVCESVTGERVEPDGYSYDGAPSWLLVFGLL